MIAMLGLGYDLTTHATGGDRLRDHLATLIGSGEGQGYYGHSWVEILGCGEG
jgi:hypothetical protein